MINRRSAERIERALSGSFPLESQERDDLLVCACLIKKDFEELPPRRPSEGLTEKTLSRLKAIGYSRKINEKGTAKYGAGIRKRVPSFQTIAVSIIASVLFLAVFLIVLGEDASIDSTVSKCEVDIYTHKGNAFISSHGMSREVRDGERLFSGEVVSTGHDGRVEIVLGDKAAIRMDGMSALLFESAGANMPAKVRLLYGEIYYISDDDSFLRVDAGGFTVRADGTALSMRRVAHSISIMMFKDSCTVISDDLSYVLNEGYAVGNARDFGSKTSLTVEDLDKEWFEWNRHQDEKSGFSKYLHELLLDRSGFEEGEPDTESNINREGNREERGRQFHSQSGAYYDSRHGIDAGIMSGNPISLSIIRWGRSVGLIWEPESPMDLDGYKIMRSKRSVKPSFPSDVIFSIDNEDIGVFIDDGLEKEVTYYYRVGAFRNESILFYSNTVSVTIPISAL